MSGKHETTRYGCPLGVVCLQVAGGRLKGVRLCGPDETAADGAADTLSARPFVQALDLYVATGRCETDPAALDLSAASGFDARVYAELLKVPAGQVVTYGQLAARIGNPGAARAVGGAVGRNPLPIFVPCHRVIAAGRRLGGFSAGLAWKKRLLAHEGWTIQEDGTVTGNRGARQTRVGVYAGSFDPPTLGHMYMIEAGAALFDRLIVAVGVNPHKACTFRLQERLEMLSECVRGLRNVDVDSFEGQFLVHYARAKGAGFVLRGIRSDEDYRFEHAIRNINEDLEPGITAVFLIPPRQICEVSSSFVKGLIGFDGWQDVIKPYVPEPVYTRLLRGDVRFAHPGPSADGPGD